MTSQLRWEVRTRSGVAWSADPLLTLTLIGEVGGQAMQRLWARGIPGGPRDPQKVLS